MGSVVHMRDRRNGGGRSGVTFVIPVHNGAQFLPAVLDAALATAGPDRAVEIIAVDDGSTDGSPQILARYAGSAGIRVLQGEGRGAAAAINLGIRAARHQLIAQIDQDVIVGPGWLDVLVAALDDPTVAAAQGHYVAAADAGIWSRVMALDLRQRYGTLVSGLTDHVCTGNSVYRKAALLDVGLFDERLGYGYDNDLSYRLGRHGYQLVFRADARSVHLWREGPLDYARQQYGFGYGRLDLVSKHRTRIGGDDVSPALMMAHAPVTLAALGALALAAVLAGVGGPAGWLALAGVGALAVLALERMIAGARAMRRFADRAGLFFAPVHFVRDAAWALAIVVWVARRALRRPLKPRHSMAGRSAGERDRALGSR